jgi:Mce-associated membrane protein
MMESLMSTEHDSLDVVSDSDEVGATESTPESTTESTAESTTESAERPARRGNRSLVIAGGVLVTIAAVCAVVFGVLWANAGSSDASNFSKMRDDALRAAEQGSINLTTLDYRNVQQGLDRWRSSTTGDLYSQLTSGNLVSTFTKQAQQAKSVTTGKVLDGVVTDLDEHAGKASALVYMQVTVSAAGSKATEKLVPLQWDLTQVNGVWKLSGIPQSAASGQ